MVYLLSIIMLSGAVVWVRTATVKTTYGYVQQERELRKLRQEIQQAKVDWLRLTAPRQLEALAKNLNLQPPSGEAVFKYAR